MAYDNNEKKMDSVFSKRIRAGKRRTYFFDVRTTRANDYYLTITESRKRFNDDGYDRHKIFLYKEDFNKFIKGLGETIDYVKTDLMPDFDFDAFNHEYPEGEFDNEATVPASVVEPILEVGVVAEEVNEVEVDTEKEIEADANAEEVKVEIEDEVLSMPYADNGASEDVDKW